MDISPQDWKYLSRLNPLALDRLCQRILSEAQTIIADAAEGNHHQAYLALYRHIQKQDRLIADCFNDWSRSRALIQLTLWRQHRLITDEEFAALSPQIRSAVAFLLGETA